MKNFFYLLFALMLLISSCNNDLENVTVSQPAQSSDATDFAKVAKINLQSTAQQEAYLNQQLNSLDLSKAERAKASKNVSDGLLSLTSQSKNLNNLGNQLFEEEKYDLALFYYFNSLQLKISFNRIEGMAISYRNVALAYQKKGDYKNAAINYWQSFYLWESLGNESRKGQLYNDLGIVYSLSHDFVASIDVEQSTALSFYEQAIETDQALNDLEGVAQAENNINVLYESWLGKELSVNAKDDEELSYDQDDVEDEF